MAGKQKKYDTVFLCMALNRDFNLRRMERYISIAWDSGATLVIILTKCDLCEDVESRKRGVEEIAAGIDIIITSSMETDGYVSVLPYLKEGKTAALSFSRSGEGTRTLRFGISQTDIDKELRHRIRYHFLRLSLDNIPQVDYTILVHLLNIKMKGVIIILKHGILGLINYHPMTGYEIMLVFRDSLRFFWSAQTSQIYRELQTLEEKGWVGKTPVPQQSKPDKNIYTITSGGRDELLRWLSDGEPELNSRSNILMKVFFLGERSSEENIRYFEGLKQYCAILLQSLDAAQEHIGQYRDLIDDRGRTAYWEMTIDFGRRNMRMYMEWAQNCIDRLKEEYPQHTAHPLDRILGGSLHPPLLGGA